ncbi:hypothetical protein N7492_006594 [Penicillium capsulatum]|uniref:Uncharacterized protein n=1 Tax=Penicillium capsulatum TaxID=69766 RepID=A0A9W9I121_9EURO|nr:hypothetical protein N7492_006594 [Penicillium capsulatum]KAJ6116429.1 hypothetical protein N7512_006154 [Penicillium capsulatum]
MATVPPQRTRVNAVSPTVLLWNYELQRENKGLMEDHATLQDRLTEAEKLTRRVTKCLEDLVTIVASLASTMNNTAHNDSSRLQALRSQLRHTLAPLAEYAEAIEKNSFLTDCIADLEKLNHLPAGCILESATPLTNDARFNIVADSLLCTHSRASSTTSTSSSTSAQDSTGKSPAHAHAVQDMLSSVMQQNELSLEDYYDAAFHFRRRQKRLKRVNDDLFIDAFLAGLDNALYRRRMTHWMRKEGWSWAWLEHIVMFIILEEEYMAKQEFALAHKFEDGSYLLPDGSREHRFIILPPITEEDLTPSECSQ